MKPNTMQPPEVKVHDGEVVGFEEFAQWAIHNVPTWNRAISLGHENGMSLTDTLKLIAYSLTLQNKERRRRD